MRQHKLGWRDSSITLPTVSNGGSPNSSTDRTIQPCCFMGWYKGTGTFYKYLEMSKDVVTTKTLTRPKKNGWRKKQNPIKKLKKISKDHIEKKNKKINHCSINEDKKKSRLGQSPSLSIVLDCRARRSGWVVSTTLLSSAFTPYSTVRRWDTPVFYQLFESWKSRDVHQPSGGECVHQGRTTCVVDVDITNQDGRNVSKQPSPCLSQANGLKIEQVRI